MAALAIHFLVRPGVFDPDSGYSALFFTAVPALFAALLALAPQWEGLVGKSVKATLIALGASGIFLGEGIVCLIMASPLILGVVWFCASSYQGAPDTWYRAGEDMEGGSGKQVPMLLVLGLVMLSGLEGLAFDFERSAAVSASGVYPKSADQIRELGLDTPRFEKDLSLFLRLGFPTPTGTDRHGDVITVDFTEGLMKFRVVEDEYSVVFDVLEDTTPISSWVEIKRSVMKWSSMGDLTAVTWTVEYRRILGPAWYFAPIMRYGLWQMGTYLLETTVSP
ncbi:MAG: hypothetical protein OXN93_09760 [bacterium]|nr:hypothetical protein [bacterium]